jgi:hypothetical protein
MRAYGSVAATAHDRTWVCGCGTLATTYEIDATTPLSPRLVRVAMNHLSLECPLVVDEDAWLAATH